MKHLVNFGLWFLVGYVAVTKAAPYMQAKIEAMDLDDAWDVFNA